MLQFHHAPLSDSANAMESWGDGSRCLKLKGQMRYMPEWESIIFLGTPVYVPNAHRSTHTQRERQIFSKPLQLEMKTF